MSAIIFFSLLVSFILVIIYLNHRRSTIMYCNRYNFECGKGNFKLFKDNWPKEKNKYGFVGPGINKFKYGVVIISSVGMILGPIDYIRSKIWLSGLDSNIKTPHNWHGTN